MLERLQGPRLPKTTLAAAKRQMPGMRSTHRRRRSVGDSTRYPLQVRGYSLTHQLETAALFLPTSLPHRPREAFRERSPGSGSLKKGLTPCLSRMRGQLACPVLRGARASNGSRLLDQIRNFSENTQESYLQQVSLFARHFRRSPEGLGPSDIRTYQVYLTNEKKLAPGSISIATSALRFLYTVTLKRPWDVEEVLPMPKAAPDTADHLEPRRGAPVLELRAPTQGAHGPHGLLRGGTAHLGSDRAQAHRHRQSAHDDPGGTRARGRRIATSCSPSSS